MNKNIVMLVLFLFILVLGEEGQTRIEENKVKKRFLFLGTILYWDRAPVDEKGVKGKSYIEIVYNKKDMRLKWYSEKGELLEEQSWAPDGSQVNEIIVKVWDYDKYKQNIFEMLPKKIKKTIVMKVKKANTTEFYMKVEYDLNFGRFEIPVILSWNEEDGKLVSAGNNDVVVYYNKNGQIIYSANRSKEGSLCKENAISAYFRYEYDGEKKTKYSYFIHSRRSYNMHKQVFINDQLVMAFYYENFFYESGIIENIITRKEICDPENQTSYVSTVENKHFYKTGKVKSIEVIEYNDQEQQLKYEENNYDENEKLMSRETRLFEKGKRIKTIKTTYDKDGKELKKEEIVPNSR